MFNDSSFLESSYQNYNFNYEYQQMSPIQLNFPVFQTNLYQEDINKCLSIVNSDYNSYDASFTSYMSAYNDGNCLKDSGIASNTTDVDEDTTSHAKKKLHKHERRNEQDECELCRNTTTYLLSTPFINYFDYKFSAADDSRVSLCSDEINYDEYKLFGNFQFAKSKKLTQKDSLNGNLSNSSFPNLDSHEVQPEFELNGKTLDCFEQMRLKEENEMQRLYPMTQHYDYKTELYSFQPTANSTPAKFLFNQYQQRRQASNNNYQHQNQFMSNSVFSWEKPVVLDPRLSARYDAVFPSLEVSSNYNYKKQSANINAMDNFQLYFCVFCKNNKQSPEVYTSHILRDVCGRICCPILRKYKCPKCGAHGDFAHTVKYCPLNAIAQQYSRKFNKLFEYVEVKIQNSQEPKEK